jgi:glycosyltransferase involved in cell wall biosynthesis
MKKNPHKRIIVSVTNDLYTDQRVKKVCDSLMEMNYEILLVGRLLNKNVEFKRDYKCLRMALLFNKGALFYAEYNFRLLLLLLFSRVDIFHANDLDTLLANYIASKIRNKPIVYDSHEYFTGVPEIQNKVIVKAIWTKIERTIFPKLKYILTVNHSIAKLYKREYGKDLHVMRNIPNPKSIELLKSKAELQIPEDKYLVIAQGAGINIDRGIEEALEAMKFLKNVCLLIVGNGDVVPQLKKRIQELKLERSVLFKNRMPYTQMMQYTQHADLGLTLDKDSNINYRLSLPNKLFDYIHANTPILASKLPEIEKIICDYDIGLFIDNYDPKHIADKIKFALENKKLNIQWKMNLKQAAIELVWKNEAKVLKDIYTNINL